MEQAGSLLQISQFFNVAENIKTNTDSNSLDFFVLLIMRTVLYGILAVFLAIYHASLCFSRPTRLYRVSLDHVA
jgi:hypothetical protein